MRPSFCIPLLLGAVLLLSCGERGTPQEGRAPSQAEIGTLLLYDSLSIAEDENLYIGNPFSLLVVGDSLNGEAPREIWVSDFYSNTVLLFGKDGRFVRRFGAPGPGPHEFTGAGQLFLSKAELGAVEFRRREMKWFNRETGEFLRTISFGSGSIGMSRPVAVGDHSLMFPLVDAVTRTSLGIFNAANREWTRVGYLPAAYLRSIEQGRGAFATYFRFAFVDTLDAESAVVAFSGSDSLYRYDMRERTMFPIGKIPRYARRGIEGECRFAGDTPDPQRTTKECGSLRERYSTLLGAWTLSGKRLAIVHTDQQATGTPPSVLITGTSYVTILNMAENTACVDLPIPGGNDARAVYDVARDVLYALDRRVDDTRSTMWLLKVPLPSPSECPSKHRATDWRSPN